MRLVIDDGYTLEGTTEEIVLNKATGEPLFEGLPVINFRYRPALPDALAEWRYSRARATSGKAEVEATAKLIADHLVSWDVVDGKGSTAPLSVEFIRKVPEPILDQMIETIATWAPKAETAAGNSPTG